MIKTDKTKIEVINGETIILDVYKIDIDDLLFNPYNTRINDMIEAKYDSGFEENNEQIQKFIYNKLVETHHDPTNKKLKSSLIKLEQIINTPVITPKKILLSGNNRLSIIRSIREKDNNRNFMSEIEVALINEDFVKSKIIDYELSLQNEIDIKKDYETMSKVFRINEYKSEQLKYSNSKKLTNEEIAIKVGVQENQVDAENEIAHLYFELLIFLGIPAQKDFYRSMPIHMHLDALRTVLGKQGFTKEDKKRIKKDYFSQIIVSTIPVQKIRDVYGKVSSLKTKEDKEIYLDKLSNITKEKEEDFIKIKKDIIEKKILDTNNPEIGTLREENKNIAIPKIDEIVHLLNEEKKDFNNSVDKAIKKLKDADNNIKFVFNMLNNLEWNDVVKLQSYLENIEESVEDIKSHDSDK